MAVTNAADGSDRVIASPKALSMQRPLHESRASSPRLSKSSARPRHELVRIVHLHRARMHRTEV